ncbi:MAG: alpha/beta hydrolase [Actinomycetota bacterium]|nr:alpha/beta hydrolase [Actinomycetota bacterium]
MDGQAIHARLWRQPAGSHAATVVLVHGLVVSSRYMVPAGEELSSRCDVYAPDLPGFGRSDKPDQTLDVPQLADALARWMTVAGVGRAALLGNSFGCQVAVDAAVRYPELVDRLVLVGPTVDPHARSGVRHALRWLAEARRDVQMAPILARDCASAGLRRAAETFRIMLDDPIERKLPQVRAPVLVVRGSRDRIVPSRWAAEAASLLPRGKLVVVPGTGHAMNFHAPLELARVAAPFLRQETGWRG